MAIILLMEASEPNLDMAIQRINVSYTIRFNSKRDRHGHFCKPVTEDFISGDTDLAKDVIAMSCVSPGPAAVLMEKGRKISEKRN